MSDFRVFRAQGLRGAVSGLAEGQTAHTSGALGSPEVSLHGPQSVTACDVGVTRRWRKERDFSTA
jgi:hypothetical protein